MANSDEGVSTINVMDVDFERLSELAPSLQTAIQQHQAVHLKMVIHSISILNLPLIEATHKHAAQLVEDKQLSAEDLEEFARVMGFDPEQVDFTDALSGTSFITELLPALNAFRKAVMPILDKYRQLAAAQKGIAQ